MHKVLLILFLNSGGVNIDTVPVNSIEACHNTAPIIKNYLANDGHIVTWGKSSSYMCIDGNTGEELVPRTFKFRK